MISRNFDRRGTRRPIYRLLCVTVLHTPGPPHSRQILILRVMSVLRHFLRVHWDASASRLVAGARKGMGPARRAQAEVGELCSILQVGCCERAAGGTTVLPAVWARGGFEAWVAGMSRETAFWPPSQRHACSGCVPGRRSPRASTLVPDVHSTLDAVQGAWYYWSARVAARRGAKTQKSAMSGVRREASVRTSSGLDSLRLTLLSRRQGWACVTSLAFCELP